jgi:Nucleotide-diphospho-sugar transferase
MKHPQSSRNGHCKGPALRGDGGPHGAVAPVARSYRLQYFLLGCLFYAGADNVLRHVLWSPRADFDSAETLRSSFVVRYPASDTENVNKNPDVAHLRRQLTRCQIALSQANATFTIDSARALSASSALAPSSRTTIPQGNLAQGRVPPVRLPKTIEEYVAQMVTLPKLDFMSHLKYEIPLDWSDNDVLLIYSSKRALPDGASIDSMTPLGRIESTEEAVRNCDFLNVVLTSHHDNKQCIALVPHWESYHIHKFARVDLNRTDRKGPNPIDRALPLSPVSRSMMDNGGNPHRVPELESIRKSWAVVASYLAQVPKSLEVLEPLLHAIAVNNTVVVMVTNFGQSELLLNFHCSTQARHVNVSNVLVVALDEATRDVATRIGYTVFYDEALFGHVPSAAAEYYASPTFTMAVMAKVQAVQMVNLLGFDVLFQDVDLVWYKNPLPFFLNTSGRFSSHDVVFQEDGARSKRFMTYFANTGFFFIKANARTRAFLNRWVLSAEAMLQYGCDQAALHTVLGESRSLYGLNIGVISRDDEEFLSGHHFHIEDPAKNPIQQMMAHQYQGSNQTAATSRYTHIRPYTLHMSHTENKDFKIKFFRQLGEWRVNEMCLQPDFRAAMESSPNCCVNEPPASSCYYRDRPSKRPCHDSPALIDLESTPSIWASFPG